MHKLEVIVTSAEEASIAEAAGADRLELIRDMDTGGLTPALEMVEAVLRAVSIPIRVILRESSSMVIESDQELRRLQTMAAKLQELPVDGLVMGWVTKDGELDTESLTAVLAAAPRARVTFHRAFEHLTDPIRALETLKSFKQIDRILTGGGDGTWSDRKQRLCAWIKTAAPEIVILAGGGLSTKEAAELMSDPRFREVHVGRAARTPEENYGAVDREKITLLKNGRHTETLVQ
jgi:copper homeostasis protein